MARPLNATAASLLGFLHHGPMTGWTLVGVAQQAIGSFWSLTQSQVYRELAAMQEAGLIEAGAVGARDAKPYRLTDAGRAAFAEWIVREPADENIRYPLLLTTLFGAHLPADRLDEMLRIHRARHEQQLERYLENAPADPYLWATLEFGIRYERAVLEWFDAVADRLRAAPKSLPANPPSLPHET